MNDLVKRLRSYTVAAGAWGGEAADRIEQLEAEVARMKEQLEKAVNGWEKNQDRFLAASDRLTAMAENSVALAAQVKQALTELDGKPVSRMTESEKALMMIDRSLIKPMDKTNA